MSTLHKRIVILRTRSLKLESQMMSRAGQAEDREESTRNVSPDLEAIELEWRHPSF